MIYADDSKFWYRNGLKHRDNDLPAVIYANGDKYWYKNGKMDSTPIVENKKRCKKRCNKSSNIVLIKLQKTINEMQKTINEMQKELIK